MTTETLLTLRDLEKRYGIRRVQLWRWRKEGRLPDPVRLYPTAHPRWRLADLIAFENRHPENV